MAVAFAALAALQLASSYYASQNVKETAKINQEVAEMNAEYADLDAYDAKIEGYTAVAHYQTVVDQTLAEQQTALTAAGVDVTYGSASTIQEETRFIAELNRMEIEKDAEERALGYTRQAREYILSGSLSATQAKIKAGDIQRRGVTSAASTGLTGYERSR